MSLAAALSSRMVGAAVACSAVALALAGPLALAPFSLLCAVLAVVVGPRLTLDRVAQAAFAIGALVIGVLVPRLAGAPSETAPGTLSDSALLLVTPMVAVATARSLISRPVYGASVTLAAALVALTGAGRGAPSPYYAALCVATLVFGALGLRSEDAGRPGARELRGAHVAGGVVIAVLTATTALGLARALPPLHDALITRLIARWEKSRTGFSDNMQLGALKGMLEGDDVVMRVRGTPPPLLRGVVLVRYGAGYWGGAAEPGTREVVESASQPPDEAGFVEIENTGKPRRYFVPLGASDLYASSGVHERDRMQLRLPSPGFPAKRVWFRTGQPDAPSPPPPSLADLELTTRVGRTLTSTLASWGISDQPPRERVRMIESRLREDFTYSTQFERDPTADPVVDFLTVRREGHCEYFASAMVLLARASRVPARVVAGYRVGERSPFGYHIVRERDAHSWAEVWIDDHWETVDPTPASTAPIPEERQETPLFAAAIDAIRTGWEAVDDWLGRRSPFELTAMLVGLVALLIGYRTVRGLRARGGPATAVEDQPLPEFVDLVRALEQRGVERLPSWTLRRLAARVAVIPELSDATRTEVVSALGDYEALRYGRRGEETEVVRVLRDAAGALRGRG